MEGGEDDLTSEINLDDYNVVPRPQELVQQQAKISSAQKRSSLKRDPSKVKKEYRETLEKIKDIKKKFEPFKSRSSLMKMSKSSDKIRDPRELTSKFDSHLLAAKKSLSRHHSKRSSPSKPSTEDSNKPRGRSSSPAIKHSSEEQNFLKIMKEPALTDYAKHEVLNAQDSYIRLREANKGGPKSKVIKGTCPDMCPEKERYSRITKNCLAFFELEKGLDPKSNSREVNHCYMVKEYSRSSADQQEPLPHELRPVPVMKFTMDYLICNIIDNIHNATSIAEWYDFVWNRTRSIRKDITQQQLCDVECVDILEKCARFHIFCAEALSEEDTATFDPKINNENLTKCLQTLKHMYHDLLTKGVQCPNEAEFRAYDILLSLSEGETLRLVKDIRKEVFKSPLVKSAFEAAIALNSNNYVKFFELMENAPYLSSCIMHRYIHEARVRAVQVIIRAYSRQNNPTVLPLSCLVKDLKFKNSEDAAYFCQWHGLTVDESVVTIQRQTFQKPTDAYPISRVESLVQQKMTTGLGMIINNGPLPENPLIWYKPQNSFDDDGLLIENLLPVSGPSDETDFEIEKEFDVAKEKNLDVEKEKESDAEIEEDMEFESPSELHKILPEAKVETPEDLAAFKVKTFENFINKSQKPKTDTFSFFTDDTVKASILKPEIQKEKFSFVCALKTTSLEPSLSTTQSLFSSANTFKTPETVAPTIQIEAVSTTQSETYKDPQTLAKTFSFKSPALSSENTFMKTSFGTNSLSFFMQASRENNSVDNVHSSKNSFFLPTTCLEKNTASTAPQVEVNHGLFSFPSSLKSMATQQDLSKACDFDEQGSDKDITYSAKPEENKFWAPSPIGPEADEFWVPSPIGPEDDEFMEDLLAGRPIGPDEELSVYEYDNAFEKISQEEKDTSDGANSHMSMENEETLNKLREEKINELILNVEDEVYSTCIKDLSSTICKEIMDEEWTIKRDYDASIENMRLNLAQKALYKWRLFCDRKKQRKAYKNSEPLSPWLPMLMHTEYVTSGATNPFVIYKKHCALSRITDSKLKEIETKRGWEPFETSHFESLSNQSPLPPAYLHTQE
ncbi:hypothetical protein JTE90_011646 [Oedothorax gibbosus]|uniref:SAC3/GANP/THP3 conserved domain-containing protein n=1 Tax=Oedothorax gibbosus TaxID=931172 RepID=A0AAV6U352_9ARAC|nr:hypothetical protein JTE90_011646 [Oedothorax gibbosus]